MASLSRPSLPSCLCSFLLLLLLLLLLQVSSSYADPFYWVSPGVLVLLAVLPVLLLQITVGLVFLCLQYRLRGKLRAEIENLHRTFDPHFLRVPCWKITLFVIVPVLGPLVALIICYNWLHRRLAGQFLEELSKFSSLSYKQRIKSQERETEATRGRGVYCGITFPEERRSWRAWVEGRLLLGGRGERGQLLETHLQVAEKLEALPSAT
ncbi:myelin-oligodendrocyte glycoprotein isoform X10 [Symphalangus syndactylus]|uniref:myelin-oligodendrocyte glycoprotein isoform X10 n=1 Tax=Symphalangus syndactylus TaxID=9590 RepID=UPI003005E7AE